MVYKKYAIEYDYQTGDSFSTEERKEVILEFGWNNLDIAKEALKRIKEHYEWYVSNNSHSILTDKKIEKPKWYNVNLNYDGCLNIPTDEGPEIQFRAPWCGFFETLRRIKIITVKPTETDMEYDF